MVDASDGDELHISIGGRVLRMVGGTLRTSIDELPTADVVVDRSEITADPVDYLQPVTVGASSGQAFEGNVLRAGPDGEGVRIECVGGIALTEALMPTGVAQDCSHIELVYSAAREAGFAEDHMVITGLSELPSEAIEVAVPVIGINVSEATKIGSVEFTPASTASGILARFNPRPDLADEFSKGEGVARAYVVGARLHDAEQSGLVQIELALAWLAVRANYGFAQLPNGDLQHFERAHAIARCRRLPVIAVCGTESSRRWLRRPAGDRVERRLKFTDESHLDEPQVPGGIAISDAHAILAARRAIVPGDLVQRVHALWEAFEFYVGAKTLPSLFTSDDREGVLEAVRDRLSDQQFDRLIRMVNGPLNDTPLMDKLVATLSDEGVVLSVEEAKALKRLRRVRGRTSHGSADAPTTADLQYGCCVLSRAIATRLARQAAA